MGGKSLTNCKCLTVKINSFYLLLVNFVPPRALHSSRFENAVAFCFSFWSLNVTIHLQCIVFRYFGTPLPPPRLADKLPYSNRTGFQPLPQARVTRTVWRVTSSISPDALRPPALMTEQLHCIADGFLPDRV